MHRKKEKDAPRDGPIGTGSAGPLGEADPASWSGGNSDKVDELRKWLTGEESLLSWLNEEPVPETELLAVGEEEGRERPLGEKVPFYEEEIARLKAEILELQRQSGLPPGVEETSDVYRRVRETTEENKRLAREIEEERALRDALKKQFEISLGSLPDDRASMIRKEIEVKEAEKALASREREIEEKEIMIKASAASISMEEVGLEDRFHAELKEKEAAFHSREQELRSKIEQLEIELKQKMIDDKLMENELKIAKMTGPEAEKEIANKIKEIQLKERSILLKDEEINRLKIEVKERAEELSKIKQMVSYKEEEMLRREEDLLYREKVLSEERRRLDEVKKEATGLDELEMKKRLEDLKSEVQRKEEELRAKEKYLSGKMEELRRREQGIIEDEISAKEEERALEFQQAKVKTGNQRLDDLLLGGIPFGSNILIHGPPFIGKEVMISQFVAEGLKKGVPAIWVVTDKTSGDIREEMRYVLSGYEEYEKLGLVKYVDSYSRSMGETTEDPYTTYVDQPTDHDKIMDAVEGIAKAYREKYEYYRLAFRSVSTLIAYSDTNAGFRFLSPFCGRRKRDKAVALYTVEKGMHGEQEIQMLGSIMDGMIDFKVDQLRTFFAVSGISEVQSRAYIRYTSSKHGLTIGSFSLDHIR